jgi:ubiquinone/menaquinone biosynthesis C-methylase UbiE
MALLGGLSAAATFTAWQVYNRRSRERVFSYEGVEDPGIAEAFNRIATLPPMDLMRWFVVRRAVSLVERQAVAMKQTGQAVDLGCGPGHLVFRLAQAAPALQITGVDLSDEMLLQAEQHARRSGLQERVSLKKGDAAQIPFPENSLDLVISTLSLHHWSDPVSVLDEMARVLRPPDPDTGQPGGSFVIFDLRRDMGAPFYLLFWFVTRYVAPQALRRVNEPLGSRDAAFTLHEALRLAEKSRLTGWRVTQGPLWLTIEGTLLRSEKA